MTVTATKIQIPLVDLRTQYQTIKGEVRAAIDEILEGMQLTIGPNVRAFDEEWARFCGTRHAVGVGSGTDALQLTHLGAHRLDGHAQALGSLCNAALLAYHPEIVEMPVVERQTHILLLQK